MSNVRYITKFIIGIINRCFNFLKYNKNNKEWVLVSSIDKVFCR